VDVLYKKSAADVFEDEDEEAVSQATDVGAETDEEAEAAESFMLEKNPVDAVLPDLTSTYKSLIDAVRAVVKFFRHDKKVQET
jgi:hypothetical protein